MKTNAHLQETFCGQINLASEIISQLKSGPLSLSLSLSPQTTKII